jgi:hypothetical protein
MMLFADKKSALVRLSDSLKVAVRTCAETCSEFLDLYEVHKPLFAKARALASPDPQPAEIEEIGAILAQVPPSDSWRASGLQVAVHSHALTAVLLSCFCLESYVNSLAYFLFNDSDYLGLRRDGRATTGEILIETVHDMAVRSKWQWLGSLGKGFDIGRAPYQDFKVLFRFRDDHVHDKVHDLNVDFAHKHYGGKLPDPVFGDLQFRHALFAAETYWAMVGEVHSVLGTDMRSFHRHYVLSPWADEGERGVLRQVAQREAQLLA